VNVYIDITIDFIR